MRIADVQLTFPAILIALLIDGIVGSLLSPAAHKDSKIYVLVAAIAASLWVNFARTVRGSTMVERNKEYVQAARVIGVHPGLIMLRHVLPNVLGPVLVIATLEPRDRDPDRGDALVPRGRRAGDPALARHA